MAHLVKTTALILALITMAGCSTTASDPTANWSVSKLYAEAKKNSTAGNYPTAIEYYETLESRFPFGVYAIQAQLDVAYTYYKFDEPESATAAADRFIKLHPRHEAVDYAYYLKGVINFGLKDSFIDKVYTRDLADYDKSIMQQSYQDFTILANRFPESIYTKDALKRMAYLRSQMARSELKAAEFYLSKGAWVAAANRAKGILESYQGSDSIQRALEIQLKSYQELGLDDLARDVQRIMDLNYNKPATEKTES